MNNKIRVFILFSNGSTFFFYIENEDKIEILEKITIYETIENHFIEINRENINYIKYEKN